MYSSEHLTPVSLHTDMLLLMQQSGA